MKTELNNCPFCGGGHIGMASQGPTFKKNHWCECGTCYARGSVGKDWTEATERWNACAWQEWQPIETAPMDGTPILAYSLRNNAQAPIVVTWRTYHPNAAGDPTWRDHQRYKVCGLTHWMPIPKLPKKEAEE